MFVTVWLGILQISTGIVTAVNAGQEYPFLKEPGGDFDLIKERHGFIVGGMSDIHYTEYEMCLKPGSALFVYTDGLPEATSAKEELFGTERTKQALNEVRDGTPEQILSHVKEQADAFVGDAPQFDDLTMLCITYYGPEGAREKERDR